MTSNNFEDYEVLTILGTCKNSTIYKVKDKQTSNTYIWKSVSFASLTDIEKQQLINEIEEKKSYKKQYILPIYNYIIQNESKVIYLISEFCTNGNLNSIIQMGLNENKYLQENLLWKILYQIAHALKKMPVMLTINNIFLDSDYNIKIFDAKEFPGENNLSTIIHQLTTLQFTKPTNFKEAYSEIPKYYSNEFREILKFILSSGNNNNEILEAILCYPTILLKNSQICDNIYIDNSHITVLNKAPLDLYSRLENLKNRETTVKHKEEKLCNKENELRKREKKLTRMERMVQEKLLHAEVYLKRCREVKTSTNGDSNKVSYANIDTSFSADCGSELRTSKKLNVNNIKKPPNFIRSLSQRHVQFKGHSPLKDMFAKGLKEDGLSKSKKKLDLSLLPERKKPFVERNQECRPASWTEESKRHAFDLLRIINHQPDDAALHKHTYL